MSRILIVDDNPSVRDAIRSSIEQQADFVVCGEAENGKVAIKMVETLKPNLVILDLSMPEMNGLEAARGISAISPGMPMIMFTMFQSASLLKEAQEVGIQQVFSKGEGFGGHVVAAMRTMV